MRIVVMEGVVKEGDRLSLEYYKSTINNALVKQVINAGEVDEIISVEVGRRGLLFFPTRMICTDKYHITNVYVDESKEEELLNLAFQKIREAFECASSNGHKYYQQVLDDPCFEELEETIIEELKDI